jgi:hypothetical protein
MIDLRIITAGVLQHRCRRRVVGLAWPIIGLRRSRWVMGGYSKMFRYVILCYRKFHLDTFFCGAVLSKVKILSTGLKVRVCLTYSTFRSSKLS